MELTDTTSSFKWVRSQPQMRQNFLHLVAGCVQVAGESSQQPGTLQVNMPVIQRCVATD